ncbi:MAG: hypothetical protein R3E32_19290 [Chitinophagales bacterium]
MKKIILVFLAFFLFAMNTFAQQIINNTVETNKYTYFYQRENNESEVIFYFYEYQRQQIDLQHFKVFHPQLKNKLPNQLELICPTVFDAFSNKVYAIAYLENCINCGEGAVVILLIGDYLSSKPVYFIDYNMDGNYQNDGIPFSFANNKKTQKIKLESKEGNKYAFWLYNTNNHKEIEYNELVKEARKDRDLVNEEQLTLDKTPQKKSIVAKDGLYLGFEIFTGSGNLEYQYINLSTNYPTNYEVSFNSGGASINIGYTFKKIQFDISASSESTYYWTSYRNTQFKEPKYTDGILESFISTVTSGDLHPKNRLSYGFSLAYNVRLGKRVALAPFINYSWFNYPNNNFYVPNKRQDNIPYELKDRNWSAFGTDIKVNFSEHSEIYVKGSYLLPNFNPAAYFNSLEIRDLKVDYSQLNFGCGYRFHF